jgi:hypothetical protein
LGPGYGPILGGGFNDTAVDDERQIIYHTIDITPISYGTWSDLELRGHGYVGHPFRHVQLKTV